jgi:hypothetical protein
MNFYHYTMGNIINYIFDEFINWILNLKDLSIDDIAILQGHMNSLIKLTNIFTTERISFYCSNFIKFIEILKVFDMSLIQINDNFQKNNFKELSRDDLKILILQIFKESSKRDDCIDKLFK